jgi:hypothetical protein
MGSPGTISLLIWLAALGALVVGVPLLWWSLFADRSKARRCPRCWHDLTGTLGLRCGECGVTARSEAALHKRRRRLGATACAIVLMAVGIGTVFWEVDRTSWLMLVPNRVLIVALPWASSTGDLLPRELAMRVNRGELTESQMAALVEQALAGDSGSRPSSRAWRQKYLTYLMMYRRSLKDPAPFDARLLELPIEAEIGFPASMPVGVPICLNLRLDAVAWPRWADARATITTRDEGGNVLGEPITICRHFREGAPPEFPVVLPALETGDRMLKAHVQLERRAAEGSRTWVACGDRHFSGEVSVEGSADDLTPVDSEAMREQIRAVFRDGVMMWEEGLRPRRVRFNMQATSGEAWEDVAVGLRVELLHNGQTARTSRIWWMGGMNLRRTAGWEPAVENADLLAQLTEESPEWTIRIRGDRDLAHRAASGDAASWWSGEVTVPLNIIPQSGRARMPTWFYPWEDTAEPAED